MKNLLLLIGLALISCKSVENTGHEDLKDEHTNEIPEINMNREHDPISVKAIIGRNEEQASSSLQILKSQIEGNILTLKIGYSGGCEKHEFKVIGNQMISKSLPPIRAVKLIHVPNGDSCREYIERDLIIDLTDLAYKMVMGSQIRLQISGMESEVLYTYSSN